MITEEMRMVAEDEKVTPEFVRAGVASGEIVIPKNINHRFRPRGIGKGLSTKVNANIGHSSDHQNEEEELSKLRICIETQADAVMDLSTGDELDGLRIKMVENSTLMWERSYYAGKGLQHYQWKTDELSMRLRNKDDRVLIM